MQLQHNGNDVFKQFLLGIEAQQFLSTQKYRLKYSVLNLTLSLKANILYVKLKYLPLILVQACNLTVHASTFQK